jgi:hypothetical protein
MKTTKDKHPETLPIEISQEQMAFNEWVKYLESICTPILGVSGLVTSIEGDLITGFKVQSVSILP